MNCLYCYGQKLALKLSIYKAFIKAFLGIPLTIIAFYFIGSIILRNKTVIIDQITHANKIALLIGVILFIIYYCIRSFAWDLLLKSKRFHIRKSSSIYFYRLSEFKRYTPGNIFSIFARISNLEDLTIPKKVTFELFIIEAILIVLTSFFVSIISLTYFINFYVVLLIILFVLIICYLFATLFLRKNTEQLLDILQRYYKVFLYLIISWIIFGLGNFFIAISISMINPYFILQVTSLFVLSWLIGYLSILAPMGLGIRELATIYSLSMILPITDATAISIVTRFFLIISETWLLFGLYIIHKFKIISALLFKITKHKYLLILSFLTTLYIVYFSYLSIQKHLNFFTGRFDLGNMDQTVWNTLQGRIFTITNPDGTNIISRLAIHSDFILILLSPFYLVWSDARMLLLIQSIIIGIGSIFVYKISQNILKDDKISLLFGLSYLLNPFIHKQNLYDFHGVSLATTFLLATYYYLIKKKYVLFAFFLLLSVLTKENIYLIAAIFGFYFMLNKKKIGMVISIVSIVIFYLIINTFIPLARGGNHFALSYFQDFGDSPKSIITNILLKPQNTIPSVFNIENLLYLKDLFLPVGFLSLFSPFYMVFALPDFAINILSSNKNLKSYNFHYAASIIPFVYISAIYGVSKLLNMFKFFTMSKVRMYIFALSFFSAWLFGSIPGGLHPAIEVFNLPLEYRSKIKEIIDKIPTDLSVASSNNLGAHLSQRKIITTIPIGLNSADVVLFLLNDEFAQPSLRDQIVMANKLRSDPNYLLVYNYHDFLVFKKKSVQWNI